MLKSTEHQFFKFQKSVQRKLNLTKEDKHIISSDAELDAKIEVFKSIAETSTELSKIIDQYQDRIYILSQEECVFGRFLNEVGKRSKTTGTSITNTAKAVSYCGTNRMCVRLPLIRLKHEVNVFRTQAVQDTKHTIHCMEKERTEYRAALSWMKSASCELDPDTGKGLEKFRSAQSHVRETKKKFDSIAMDCIQKIDLLAAARCNMYSQALVSYMTELKQFAQKTESTFETISNVLQFKPKYDFCVLKELTQNEGDETNTSTTFDKILLDEDQALFFAKDDYSDKGRQQTPNERTVEDGDMLIELPQQDEDILSAADRKMQDQSSNQINPDIWENIFGTTTIISTNADNDNNMPVNNNEPFTNTNQSTTSTGTTAVWYDLLTDVDPLTNPEMFDMKLNGRRCNNSQHT